MPLPMNPVGQSNTEVHDARMERDAERFATLQQDYYDAVYTALLAETTLFWRGRCVQLAVASKTATVQLDPFPDPAGGAPPIQQQTVHWGRATWTAAEVVNKRVRIGFIPSLGYGWLAGVLGGE